MIAMSKIAMPATASASEVLPSDALTKAVTAIENIPTAEAAIARIKELRAAETFNAFEIGGVLRLIHDRIKAEGKGPSWFSSFSKYSKGYGPFDGMVEPLFGFSKSTAYSLMKLYATLSAYSEPWEKVKDIDVSKLRLLCEYTDPKVITAANFSKRLESIRTKTFDQTRTYLIGLSPKKHLKPLPGAQEQPAKEPPASASTAPTPAPTSTMAALKAAAPAAPKIVSAPMPWPTQATPATSTVKATPTPTVEAKPAITDDQMIAEMQVRGVAAVLALLETAFPELNMTVETP